MHTPKSLEKRPRFESRALLNQADGRACVLCGACGSTVPAHLPGSFYGMPAGVGEKTHDWLVAHLCHECHTKMDGPDWRRDPQIRMKALCLTLERLFISGAIVVSSGRGGFP